jgi:hypothetical protein
MVIGTGKELVAFAERNGAIISQPIWEALTDLDKCAPKAVVENCHSLQQLKAEIAARVAKVDAFPRYNIPGPVSEFIEAMRQLSAIEQDVVGNSTTEQI